MKAEHITFYTQVVVIVIVVLASIINLTIRTEPETLWIMLLTSCVGYVLPNPRLGCESKDITMRESLMVTDGSTLVTTSAGNGPVPLNNKRNPRDDSNLSLH